MTARRIGIDYRPALLGRSGIGRYVRELVRVMPDVATDLELRLFGAFWKEIGPRAVAAPHERITLSAPRFPGRLLQWLGQAGLAAAETFTGPVDLFHRTDYVDLPVRSRCRTATVHDLGFLRDPSWYEPDDARRLRGVTERLVRESTLLLADSQTTAVDLMERYNLGQDRVATAILGVDKRFFEIPDPEEGDEHLLMVGTIEPRKNHDRVLDAFEKLKPSRPRLSLTVVGRPGWCCAETVRRLERLNDEGVVRWLRAADESDLLQAMTAATVVLYPSLWEGFGLPVLEGMASGRPVLTADRGATMEVGGDAVALVDPESISEITNALEALLDDTRARAELSMRGRVRARQFTWARCAEQTAEAWERALEMSR